MTSSAWVAVNPASAPDGVRFQEHTADIGLEVEAPSLEECFARAAAGLFSSFAEEAAAAGEERTITLSLSATSLEELLVLWLEELLYRADADHLSFTAFRADAVDDTSLRGQAVARVAGSPAMAEPPIKGVTRHDLWVRQAGDTWRAHVILDV
ncbi:MAG TPA: archease [Candidatus Limnocylindria bacterium]|nr:archease [Candidatus Limnocylindria bacterium]